MQCNLDAKGKLARLIGGAVTCAVAVVLAGLTAAGVLPGWVWWAAAGCLAGGLFQLYEGWAGWCVVKAVRARRV